mmetsp:Transcript_10528/g.36735  ORF Transcript_10528/g.36735 Transcript_10528/m.36735 type:complete len:220 (+) Transcript_10528:2820-3479(+)
MGPRLPNDPSATLSDDDPARPGAPARAAAPTLLALPAPAPASVPDPWLDPLPPSGSHSATLSPLLPLLPLPCNLVASGWGSPYGRPYSNLRPVVTGDGAAGICTRASPAEDGPPPAAPARTGRDRSRTTLSNAPISASRELGAPLRRSGLSGSSSSAAVYAAMSRCASSGTWTLMLVFSAVGEVGARSRSLAAAATGDGPTDPSTGRMCDFSTVSGTVS